MEFNPIHGAFGLGLSRHTRSIFLWARLTITPAKKNYLLILASVLSLLFVIFLPSSVSTSWGNNINEFASSDSSHISTEEARKVIVSLYAELLGRDPDQEGLNTYLSLMAIEGKTEEWVRNALLKSEEYQRLEQNELRSERKHNRWPFAYAFLLGKTFFSKQLESLIAAATVLILASIVLFLSGRNSLALFALLLATAVIRFFSASLDPFLNLWDERFHALVAKNILSHPLTPMLYSDPVIPIDYTKSWDTFHIWLHKQPLFLWQIALSFKFFGFTEFALRLPSITLSTLLVFMGYRVGRICIGKDAGYFTALLISTSFYINELVSGRQEVDHNDIVFVVYVSASIWAWVEYRYSQKKLPWAAAIGFFSGLAILTKWLVGLLIFAGWSIGIQTSLMSSNRDEALSELKKICLSVLIACAVALPWQFYILYTFPDLARHEYAYSARHFSQVMEGHGGDRWFYFRSIPYLYGEIVAYVAIFALYLMSKRLRGDIRVGFLTMIVFTYIFFTLAKTKMHSFPFVVCIIIYLALAVLLKTIFDYFDSINLKSRYSNIVKLLFLIVIAYFNMRFSVVENRHTLIDRNNNYRKTQLQNKNRFLRYSRELPNNTVVFNIPGRHYVEAMFYTGLTSYNTMPSYEDLEQLSQLGRPVAVRKTNSLPPYLESNRNIYILK